LGAVTGAVIGGVAGGVIGGISYAIQKKSFSDGFLYGAVRGTAAGAFAGAIQGYTGKFALNAVKDAGVNLPAVGGARLANGAVFVVRIGVIAVVTVLAASYYINTHEGGFDDVATPPDHFFDGLDDPDAFFQNNGNQMYEQNAKETFNSLS
jgi:hypothetical protein